MNQWPRITVVTPSYNQGKFLEETISSIITQNYPNLEYFIVDGGSMDNSVDIIKKYEDKIDWWISEKDEGQSDAINKGFERASGELLCWVNSDDVFFPRCLEEVAVNYLKNGKPDLIHANCVYIDQDGTITKLLRVPRQTRFFMYHGVWSAPAPSVFFKASLLRQVGYLNKEYHLSMDVDIWMRMIKADAVVHYIPKYLGAFRWHATSKSTFSLKAIKQISDENPEAKRILDAALPHSKESTRQIWRKIWKLYRLINLNYLRSFFETQMVKRKHWKQVFAVNNSLQACSYNIAKIKSNNLNGNIRKAIQSVKERFPFHGYMDSLRDKAYLDISETVLRYLKPGDSLLDFGAGPCDKTAIIQTLGINCSAYDDLKDNWHRIEKNRKNILDFAREFNINFRLASDDHVPFDKNSFDMLMMSDVLEHLHDSPRDLLNELLELVKDRGFLLATVPNAVNIRKRIYVLFGKTNLPPFDDYFWYLGPWRGHIREYTKDDLKKLSAFLNLEIIELRSCDYMLGKLPRILRPIYLAFSTVFRGWKDSWLLVARKRKDWKPNKTLHQN